MRELIYYVAVSLDGLIAGPDHQFDAFTFEGDHMAELIDRYPETIPTSIAQHLGVAQPPGAIDTVLMGWHTYAVGLDEGVDSPYRHLEQIVFSRQQRSVPATVTLTAEDPLDVVRKLKAGDGGDLWLCGGGRLAGRLRAEIDRFVVKQNPVLLGAGRPMFAATTYAPRPLELLTSTRYESGVVVSEYRAARPRTTSTGSPADTPRSPSVP